MNWWQRVLGRETRALGRRNAPAVTGSLQSRVALIIHNPITGGRRLTEVLGWHDPDDLARQYQADLYEASGGQVAFDVVERVEVDGWVPKRDGFRYDEATYLRCWRNQAGFHQPDAADYAQLITDFDLARKVEDGFIDEVWLFAYPYAGYYESTMAGPGAFWCNSPPVLLAPHGRLSRRFVLMGFNYERGVGCMLESFGHRVESHLQRVWERWRSDDNLWERFARYDLVAPGRANCGNMHFAPNSVRDYDWGNPRHVLSNCDDWLNFPDFRGVTRRVNCAEWGNGDMRAHHLWWLRRLPRAPGETRGILNNWWVYAVDPNAQT